MGNRVQSGPSSEASFPFGELIGIIPDLLWLAAVAALVLFIGVKRIRTALERATKISVAGIEVDLANDIQDAAAAKSSPVEGGAATRAARRIAGAEGVSAARVLWVDDNPENNSTEIHALRQVKVAIDLAKSTDEARDRLAAGVYDIILSDMKRGDDEEAGRALIPIAAGAPNSPALIFYVGTPQDVPLGAFGLTTRPDELLHLIVDAMSRRAG